jgi:hypothetical protein
MKSVAEKSLEFTGLFEAEVFIRLMLWRWQHPLADDEVFANELLESASIILRDACDGTQVIETVPAESMNFVAAVWYVENNIANQFDADSETIKARFAWLATVRRGLPSCFCDPADLG